MSTFRQNKQWHTCIYSMTLLYKVSGEYTLYRRNSWMWWRAKLLWVWLESLCVCYWSVSHHREEFCVIQFKTHTHAHTQAHLHNELRQMSHGALSWSFSTAVYLFYSLRGVECKQSPPRINMCIAFYISKISTNTDYIIVTWDLRN